VAAAVCPPLAGSAVALPWTRDRLSAALRDDWPVVAGGLGARLSPGTRVLLAEDEPSNRRILTEMLSRLGASVVAVGDGLEAVEAVAADRFDVVLLDLSMPVMDGREAAVEIRQRLAADRCPAILALTADAATDFSILARSGFSGQVRKPATSADLRMAIASVMTGPMAAQAQAANTAPVAVEVLTDLVADLGDSQVVEQTLDIYLEELPGRLVSMSDALASEHFDTLRDSAHALKSSSLMLGAVTLSDLCRDLEAVTAAQSRAGISSGGDLAPTVDALHTEALRVAQWLAEFREAGYPGLSH
jgi:CheY-like chemotaxis protein